LHTTPYSETSVVAKVFTRQLGVRSYIIKGVRGGKGGTQRKPGGRSGAKLSLLQPLSSLDMVVYDNSKTDLNYIKEMTSRHPDADPDPIDGALRFFMTEVLYKSLREAEPMPALWDYVESMAYAEASGGRTHVPIRFLLTVARHLGIEPRDNYSHRCPLFCLQEGEYVSTANETTLSPSLSETLHQYLNSPLSTLHFPLDERTSLVDALIAYYHLHLSGFSHFRSHEILHTILI
jgi:DNA repair protein RecO (recombination protein O)